MQARDYLKLSVAVALATIGLKTAAWWLTGSVGLLSDALESLVNLAGASFALWMVAWAEQPADAEHPYGHHKAEYFASAFEGMLIVAAALAILWAAVDRWLSPQPLQQLGLGMGLSVVASVLNGALAVAMLRKGREVGSMALEGDARHLLTDVWTTAGVLVGLLAVQATGSLWLDPLLAMMVAANILREGYHLMRRSADGLMDRALDDTTVQTIRGTLARFEHDAVRFDHLVTRRAGQRRFADLHTHLPASLSAGRGAAQRPEVERALMDAVPGLRASIQLLPTEGETEMAKLGEHPT